MADKGELKINAGEKPHHGALQGTESIEPNTTEACSVSI